MTSANRLVEELEVEAQYQRKRLQLYRAEMDSAEPTSVAHLRQRERECKYAAERLRTAQVDLSL